MADDLRFVATDVDSVVISNSGHWLMEEQPATTVAASHLSPKIKDWGNTQWATGVTVALQTDAGTPCVRFRDHGTSADAPKSHCENTVFIRA